MLQNRIELAEYLAKREFRKGAEVGVFAGYFTGILLDKIPGLKLVAVDNWDGLWRRSKKAFDDQFANDPRVRTVDRSSVEAATTVPDYSLDFVYIDAAHDYQNVKKDITAWYPKVHPGGIVCGDDYYLTRHGNEGVIRAVNEFVKEHNIELHITNWDLDNPVEDDRQPQWWFVKP